MAVERLWVALLVCAALSVIGCGSTTTEADSVLFEKSSSELEFDKEIEAIFEASVDTEEPEKVQARLNTALVTAVDSLFASAVVRLIKNGADTEYRLGGRTPVLFKVLLSVDCFPERRTQTIDRTRYILEALLKGRGFQGKASSTAHNGAFFTPLHAAAEAGRADLCSLLFSYGANVDPVQPATLLTPLHLAALHGRFAVVGVLLKAGADTSLRSFDGDTAVQYAKMRREERITSWAKQRDPALYVNSDYDKTIALFDKKALLKEKP